MKTETYIKKIEAMNLTVPQLEFMANKMNRYGRPANVSHYVALCSYIKSCKAQEEK